MDEPQTLADRVAALEADVSRMAQSLAVIETWASRYGVKVERAVAGAPAENAAAESAVPARRAGLSADQLVVRTMYGVGLIVLLVGGAIFLPNLASIEPHARTLLGIALGLAAIVGGARRPARTWQADGVLALGAGLEYLSLWYAHAAQLAALPVCAFAMFAVTAMLGALSYVHRSERLAFAGLLGGYLTPLLIATDQPDFVGLNAYLLVLGAAALTLSVARGYKYVETAVFAFVALYATQWATGFDEAWRPPEALAAASLHFLELSTALIAGAARGGAGVARSALVSLSLFGFAFFLAIELARLPFDHVVFRAGLLGLALVCVAAARVPAVALELRAVYAWWALGAVGIALQGIAPTSCASGAFAAEAAVLAGIAGRARDDRFRVAAAISFMVAFFIAAAHELRLFDEIPIDHHFFNGPFVSNAGIVLGLAAALALERRSGSAGKLWLGILRVSLHAFGAFVVANQAYTILPGEERAQLGATAALTAYATLLIAAGVRLRRGLLRALGALLFLIVVAKIFLIDLSGVDALVRFLSFLGVGTSLVGVAIWYQRVLARDSHDVVEGAP